MAHRIGRHGRRMVGAVAALGLVLGAAACGGDDDSGSSAPTSPSTSGGTTTAAAKPTGAPVKIMVVTAVDSPIQDYPDVFAAAKAAANAINAAGGVNGQPLQIETCNDKSEPNAAGACGRQAVKDKVAAVTGYTIGNAVMLPILEAAGIQWVAGYVGTKTDATAPNSWPVTGGSPLAVTSMPVLLQNEGVKTAVSVAADVSASTENIGRIEQSAEQIGLGVAKSIKIPIDAIDFAPYVQQLKDSKADGAAFALSFQQILQLTKAIKQLGADMKIVNLGVSYSTDLLKELGDDAEGGAVVGALPPISSPRPAMKQFNAEMDAAKAAGVSDSDNRREATVSTWLAIHAIAELGKRINGDIDAASVTKALETEKDIDLLGLTSWTPSKPGPKEYPRVNNSTIYPGIVKNGVVVENGEPFDLYAKLGWS